MSEKICIFTDSAADLRPEEITRWNIEIAPLRVLVDGKTYLEHFEITPQEYWELMETCTEYPQTSQVSMEHFLNIYKKAKETGCTHCIGVLINSLGSGTYQAACITRDMFYDEYGEDMLEVYKPANKKALDNIYNIITMEEAPEVENLFNIDRCRFCFARPLNR